MKMTIEAKNVLNIFVRIIFYVAIIVLQNFIIFQDAQASLPLDAKFSEESFTEIGQEVMAICCAIIFLLTAVKRNPIKENAFDILMCGFFLMVFVREFNNYMKANFFDGAWQAIVYSILAITILLVLPRRKLLMSQISDFFQRLHGGIFLCGGFTVFFFSRLFGEEVVWANVAENLYVRSIKNAAEEGVELYGYALFLIGALEYLNYLLRKK